MRAKLSSARFRHLNEQLYTTPSSASLALFSATPELFTEYHAGFRQQVAIWPENPVEAFLADLRARGKVRRPHGKPSHGFAVTRASPLPRARSGLCTVADLGCGDAALAAGLQASLKRLNLAVLSFDLHAAGPLVTRADVANLPLPDGAVDVAVFCLALMGTNWPDFVDEAWRVLRWRGELWVAEIKSRFARVKGRSVGGIGAKRTGADKLKEEERNDKELARVVDEDAPAPAGKETDVSAFVDALRKRGFALAGTEKEAVETREEGYRRTTR